MHILQINTEKGWRGGERQTLLAMEGLRDAGIGVTLLCLRGHPLWERARKAGFTVVGAANHFDAVRHLILKGRDYSILHAQSSRAFGFAAIASLFMRTPLIYSRHVDFVPRGLITRWKYQRAAALVAISSAIQKVMQTARLGEVTLISEMVTDHRPDPERCAAIRREFAIDRQPVVGIVAALVGHKDPVTMVRTAAIVHERLPDALFLHFGEGDLRGTVEETIRSLKLEKSYTLCGYREGVEDYFPLFDCFVMSSKMEGLGSSVFDAFEQGIAVASTSAGGLAELVEGRGLVCPPGDPDALAANIIRLLTDRQLAADLSEKARQYVGMHHSRAGVTAQYIDLYRKVIAERSP